jgi:ribosome-binding factor A
MSFKRADKVSEAIKREVSVMLAQEVKDPGIHFVTVTAVETADEDRKETLAGLDRAKGFLRSEIGRRLQLRYAPQVHFRIDKSLDHAFKIKGILDKLKDEGKKNEAAD